MLIAYRLAEDERVRLPVIVNLDGFYLSFTREPVELPDQKAVRDYVGTYDPETTLFRASAPSSQGVAVLGGGPYSYFRYELHLAARNALAVYDLVADEFARQFGREHAAVEAYRMDDADIAFVMMGSFATKARAAVDRLRDAGLRVGLVRPRLLRPFPEAHIKRLLKGKQGVAVIDQNLSMGLGGVLHSEVASALYGQDGAPAMLVSFVAGLGGRDIADEEFFEMVAVTQRAIEKGEPPPPRLLYTEAELREVRKLQAIAHVEYEELRRAGNENAGERQ
jgi:pyruvate ferredoxin oxidoreductase alpha subunit